MLSMYLLIFYQIWIWKCIFILIITIFNSKPLLESVIIVIWVVLALARAHEKYACIGAPEVGHIFVPSPLSCNHYILCMSGLSHVENCPAGYDFNVGRQECSHAGTVDCTQCSSIGMVNLRDPNDCNAYVECMFGIRTQRTCPAGYMFDRTIGNCNLAHLVQCPGVFPTEDPNSTTPDFPAITSPGPITTAIPWPVCVTGGLVHHAHPTNCRRFFICFNNILMEDECPSNLHWNERTVTCDLPANAQCFRES